jgi:RHS repeat-associated protein
MKMKKLLIILLVLPFVMYAQSTNENYVVTKVYKKGTTSTISGNNKDQVMTNVQYFDGLGRLKQTVAVNAGGNVVSDNAIPIDWTLGNTGPTDFFTAGSTAENRIINGSTPFGGTDLLWECIPDAASNFDGGWNTKFFKIDNTKTYRYSIWVKRTGSQVGATYHGTQSVDNLDGTPNSNPYFWAGDLPQLNTWYLMVGIVHPHTYGGSDTGVSGVYDINGNKVSDGTEYRWRSDDNATRLRNYLYYCTDTNVRQYFWSPLFQEIDGGELPLEDLVTQNTTVIAQENVKDIVSHVEYDNQGRMTKEYLPFTNGSGDANFRTGEMGTETQRYYANKYAKDFAGVTLPSQVNAYSEKAYDYSPLNRVTQQAAPGADWKLGNGHEIKFDYDVNSTGEVKVYSVTTSFANNTYTPTLVGGTASYGEGELSKTVTKDENWSVSQTHDKDHTTEEFKNKSGQVILKRTYNLNQPHDTYYVYDDFGNLTYVIPPKAEGSVAKPTATQLSELCYQYVYDYRNRLVEKKIPGKGWEYIVYDNLDRPVLTQDALQAAKTVKEWLFTKYDQLGRVVYTGYQTNSMNRVALQNAADTGPYTQYEVRTAMQNFGSTGIYYSRNAIPNSITQVYTINYYDTYVDLPDGFVAPTKVYSDTDNVTTNTKGLATVSKVKVLGTNSWITTITYYDEKARPIYVYSKNDYLQTVDVVESKLDDFTGKVLETKTTHTKTGKDPIVTIDRFEYDHMDRLVSQNQQINDQISERIVKNNYNDLGQLESKIVGNGTKTGYRYNNESVVSVSDNIITKVGGVNAQWDGDISTQGSISGDGYVEFISETKGKYYMAGLSNNNNTASFQSIKYAIYLNHSVYIYESGANKGISLSYDVGDIFRVERIGNTIHYKKNGETFYVSTKKSTEELFGDVSMYHVGSKIKDFKIVDNTKGLQKVDYKYNVRGWLTNINDDIQVDNDLFNFSIQYNDPSVELSKRLYNGNIAQTSWQTQNVDVSRKTYNYSYDALNRIKSALDNTSRYNLDLVNYDKNGNILNLMRKGAVNDSATLFDTMDDLEYAYDNGNKLMSIEDHEENPYGFKGSRSSFTYDANGNMKTDSNKRITNISYNHLNLPTLVEFGPDNNGIGEGEIEYVYSADGVKLKKHSTIAEGDFPPYQDQETFTEYAGNYIYEGEYGNMDLQFFNHAEGYVKYGIKTSSGGKTAAEPSFEYVYQYKDHLGNIRLSYTDVNGDGVITASTEIIEEKNYYPFGLQHKGYNDVISSVGNSTAQRFSLNGKELEESLGLNLHQMDMRQYDATIGRWTGIDLVIHYNFSTYSAFDNNPVYFADPSGADATSGGADWSGFEFGPGREYYKNKNSSSNNESSKEKACCGEAGADRMIRQRTASKLAERNGTSSLEEYNKLMQIEGEAGYQAAKEGLLMLAGEWALVKVFQGGVWIFRIIKAKNLPKGISIAEGGLKYSDEAQKAIFELGSFHFHTFIKNGVGRVNISFTKKINNSALELVEATLKANGAKSVKVITNRVTPRMKKILNYHAETGKKFKGYSVKKRINPLHPYELTKTL